MKDFIEFMDRADVYLTGKVVPFVVGLNLGILVTVAVFVITYNLCHGR